MSAHAPDTTPTVGDLRGTIRLLQRRLNVIEHLCDEADTIRAAVLPVATIRAALRSNP